MLLSELLSPLRAKNTFSSGKNTIYSTLPFVAWYTAHNHGIRYDDGLVFNEKMQPTKIRRWLRTLEDDEIVCDIVGNDIDAVGKYDHEKFFTVTGDEIIEYYRKRFGRHTCMSYDHALEYLKFYAKEPRIKLLLYKGEVNARALMWCLNDTTILIDRIYPNSGHHIAKFARYAKDNGYIMRKHQGCGSPEIKNYDTVYSITMAAPEKNKAPYLDTFSTGDYNEEDNTVTLYTNYSGSKKFLSSEGTW